VGARPWTPEQRREHAERMKEYWRTHEHPRKGQPTRPETKALMREAMSRERLEQKGYCKSCGGPLFSNKSADLGYGPDCLVKAVEAGEITYDQYADMVLEIGLDAQSGEESA